MLKFIGEFEELEKFGFKKRYSIESGELEFYDLIKYDNQFALRVIAKTRILIPSKSEFRKTEMEYQDVLFDLIQSGLVVKSDN